MKFNKYVLISSIVVLLGCFGLLTYQNRDTIFNKQNTQPQNQTNSTSSTPSTTNSPTTNEPPETTLQSTRETVEEIIQDTDSIISMPIENDSSILNPESSIISNIDNNIIQNQSL